MQAAIDTDPGKVEDPLDDMDFNLDFAVTETAGGGAGGGGGKGTNLGKFANVNVDDVAIDDMHILVNGPDDGIIGGQGKVIPSQRQRSAPQAIPTKVLPGHHQQTAAVGSRPSSAGSTGSAFLNHILNPAGTFNGTHMSHTPPTHVSTSYEVSHFGKRPRSGSLSERLRVSTELEQKGMISREQKGILKDLIISGQDNELQHALDMYEQGDVTMLETMLQSGALSNTAMSDIDLLGDLDLDFLNVNDDQGESSGKGARQHSYNTRGAPIDQSMRPPPSLPTKELMQQMTMGPGGQTNNNGVVDDGIGELDFDGGIDGSDNFGPLPSYARAPSPAYHNYGGQRSRSNSTISVDYDFRQRSNSLFSALIGNVPNDSGPVDYGRWMERSTTTAATDGGYAAEPGDRRGRLLRRKSAPNLKTNNTDLTSDKKNKQSKNKNSKSKTLAATKREQRAEEKRREKQEKKEQKEREKQEKREKREQAKLEKQKKAEMDEKEEYQPGSGRPRSMSDPNLRSSYDVHGLLQVERPDGWIGAYSPESRKVRIARFMEKRNHRVWTKTVKYDVRKNFADSRLRVKGRFVKKEDELLMRELMSLT